MDFDPIADVMAAAGLDPGARQRLALPPPHVPYYRCVVCAQPIAEPELKNHLLWHIICVHERKERPCLAQIPWIMQNCPIVLVRKPLCFLCKWFCYQFEQMIEHIASRHGLAQTERNVDLCFPKFRAEPGRVATPNLVQGPNLFGATVAQASSPNFFAQATPSISQDATVACTGDTVAQAPGANLFPQATQDATVALTGDTVAQAPSPNLFAQTTPSISQDATVTLTQYTVAQAPGFNIVFPQATQDATVAMTGDTVAQAPGANLFPQATPSIPQDATVALTSDTVAQAPGFNIVFPRATPSVSLDATVTITGDTVVQTPSPNLFAQATQDATVAMIEDTVAQAPGFNIVFPRATPSVSQDATVAIIEDTVAQAPETVTREQSSPTPLPFEFLFMPSPSPALSQSQTPCPSIERLSVPNVSSTPALVPSSTPASEIGIYNLKIDPLLLEDLQFEPTVFNEIDKPKHVGVFEADKELDQLFATCAKIQTDFGERIVAQVFTAGDIECLDRLEKVLRVKNKPKVAASAKSVPNDQKWDVPSPVTVEDIEAELAKISMPKMLKKKKKRGNKIKIVRNAAGKYKIRG